MGQWMGSSCIPSAAGAWGHKQSLIQQGPSQELGTRGVHEAEPGGT